MGEGKVIYRAGVVPTFINTWVAKARILERCGPPTPSISINGKVC